MRRLPFFLVLLAALTGCAATAPRSGDTVAIKVLAINDFHGNLLPPAGGFRMRDPQDPAKSIEVAAGGAAHLASAVRQLSSVNPNHVFVAAGDLVGASPLLSALFDDEPTVESLGLMGLAISAVGNHEFDRGAAELLRLQRGGCHPEKGCKGPTPFAGASFQYLAASTIDTRTGQTLLPAYAVKRFEGIPVAFIGLTLKSTPQIVMPAGVAGLEFRDEAATVNALVPELRRQGIEAIVVLIHEGGYPASGDGDCPGLSGPIVPIVRQLDPAVDLVISGHTHRAYVCRIDGRLVTSADRYGTLLGEIDLLLDSASGDVREASARNVVVRTDMFAEDPAQTRLIEAYERLSAPLARRVVGRLTAPLSRDEGPAGESPLGQVVADAQLAATIDAGAQLALTNPGGLRAPLAGDADGTVRYEDLFAAQPFSNALVTITLSGAQLLQVLEQQWAGQTRPRMLQVSRGLSYTWDATRPVGQRIVPGSLQLHGVAMAPEQRLRVTVNAYLASGGDNFKALAENGTDAHTGIMDIDALEQYFRRAGTVSPAAAGRIRRLN
jgi:5'-nucleotidase